jgi:hypothetical protein
LTLRTRHNKNKVVPENSFMFYADKEREEIQIRSESRKAEKQN